MSIYLILIHVHSVLRWVLLIFLVYSIIISLWKWKSSSSLSKRDSLAAALTVHFSHLQLLVGTILYFISSKVMFNKESMASPITRFFTTEHITIMIIAIACLTIGNVKAKKATNNKQKAPAIQDFMLPSFGLTKTVLVSPIRRVLRICNEVLCA